MSELIPYLARIDENRFYTNFGPLTEELRIRLGGELRVDPAKVVLANSGTTALCAAILSVSPDRSDDRGVALVPSYTFPATALAAELCGYKPVVLDVDQETWGLEPGRVREELTKHKARLVVVVTPMGRSLDQAPWIDFQDTTGVPVVIDAAAGFENIIADPKQHLGVLPTAVSFHATKAFTTAEGGCVVVDDVALADRANSVINFGFRNGRVTEATGLNGKLSEYHAAIGLASLDTWAERRENVLAIGSGYEKQFAELGAPGRLWTTPTVASNYVLYEAPTIGHAELVRDRLSDNNVGTRDWYAPGLHRQEHFMTRSSGSYTTTDDLAARFLGLPSAPDLEEREIKIVVSFLGDACL